ncbi:MAG: GNAT family N-acetyltransferase [Deltaproteobacteria bacterium]|nr:GNAT family N-acetyltransferase [Deltaproteobacteria bacterium]
MGAETTAAAESVIIEAVLRDGRSVKLRRIRPDDKAMLEAFFYKLTPYTRYLRFHYAKEKISAEELKHFTEVTPPKRYAVVALMGEAADERIIAVGRWDVAEDAKNAELAFAVADNIQLSGIGSILLEELVKAAAGYRIARFTARVLPENTRMIELFENSGFKTVKVMDEGAFVITVDIKDAAGYEERAAYREHVARSAGVNKILAPKRVAVVGASRSPESVGGAVFRNLLKDGFNGVVFPVNPNAPSIAGVLAYPTVLDVPGDIDVGVIVVPAEHVLAAVEQCAMKGATGVVIISAGFSEAGKDGKEREHKLIERCLAYGLRVIGPNCLGAMNNSPDVKFNATFSPVTPPSGGLSIGSQSGALGLALLDHARSINLGIKDFVSIGNRIDISNNDLLEFWEDDPATRVIVLYLESFGNPRKFGRIARRISYKKPIIAIKSGKSAAGAAAAGSHTGALAAPDIAVDALFRQAGVIRVNSIQSMFNAAEILAHQPLPKGPRVGILTNAGGPGVLAADACDGLGLKVQPLSAETQARLREFLPKAAATTNPVDMIATAPAESFKRALSVMLDDPELDSIIVIYIPPMVTKPADIASAIGAVLTERVGEKPVVTCFMMSQEALTSLRKNAVSALRPFIFPEDAVYALALSYEYSRYREMDEGTIIKFSGIDADGASKRVFNGDDKTAQGWLMPEAAMRLIKDYGIGVAETVAASTPDEAAAAADAIGCPVAVKLRSSTITHKTDVRGVITGVKNGPDAKAAFAEIKASLEARGLGRQMEGVIVQKMSNAGTEMIIGVTQDPVFGPVIMLGFGGVQVELVKDVSFSIHPLRDVDPDRMLERLKSLPMLLGYRGRPVCDVAALKETLLRLSALIEDFPEIEQMEINPLIVLSEGQGCVAVDARVKIK